MLSAKIGKQPNQVTSRHISTIK